jgi:transposase
MNDRELYQRILGLVAPWEVLDIRLSFADRNVTVVVGHAAGKRMACSVCGVLCGVYDHRPRRWRHLDTCQLQTVIEASVPRVSCPEHGVLQVRVPWAEEGSGFTALFESMVISWLQAANISAVSALVGLSWDEVDGIQQRAVDRGLARRQTQPVAHVAIDETSFQKRHEYVSVITDRERGVVLEVLEDRTKEHISSWLILQGTAQLSAIKSVSMDMWPAFINAFLEQVPEAKDKICFDRYHIASYFGNAVRKVRNQEHKKFIHEDGVSALKGITYDWLRTSANIDNRTRPDFMKLSQQSLKTSRAWAIKEQAGKLWKYISRIWAEKGWKHLLQWIDRCRLEPVKKVGRMIKKHLWGILNAVVLNVTNAISESMNAKIKKNKKHGLWISQPPTIPQSHSLSTRRT